jgi:hypothetical protein
VVFRADAGGGSGRCWVGSSYCRWRRKRNGGQVSNGVRLQRVGVRRGVAKVGRKWRNFGGTGAESRTVGVIRCENPFTFTRTGIEITKVAVCRDQKRDPRLVVKGLGQGQLGR